MNLKKTLVLSLFALSTVALICPLAGCGYEGGQMALRLTVLDQSLNAQPSGAPAAPGAAPAGIDAFRLCVQKPGGKAESCKDYTDLSASKYKIGGLPIGSNWVVTFQGFLAADRRVVWCGRTKGVNIQNQKTAKVSLLLTRCGDFTRTVEQPNTARVFHDAASNDRGLVFLSGGYDSHFVSSSCEHPCQSLWASTSVEIYDHHLGTFEESSVSLTHARGFHASRVLADGRLLVAGGCEVASLQSEFNHIDRPGSPLRCLVPGEASRTAEIIDPRAGTSEVIEIPTTIFAAALPVGQDGLLLLGGEGEDGLAVSRALLLTMENDQLSVRTIEQALVEPRSAPLAVMFSRPGEEPVEALVVGGRGAPDWDNSGNFAERLVYQAGSLASNVPRFIEEMFSEGFPVVHASGSRSSPGRVILSGGMYPSRFLSQDIPFYPEPLETAGSADLRTERLTVLDVSNQLLDARAFHTSTTVDAHGHVLVCGGFTIRQPNMPMRHQASSSIEWWDDEAGFFSLRWVDDAPAQMEAARAGHSATLMPDGTVLIVGGTDGEQVQLSAELFNPATTELGEGGLPPL